MGKEKDKTYVLTLLLNCDPTFASSISIEASTKLLSMDEETSSLISNIDWEVIKEGFPIIDKDAPREVVMQQEVIVADYEHKFKFAISKLRTSYGTIASEIIDINVRIYDATIMSPNADVTETVTAAQQTEMALCLVNRLSNLVRLAALRVLVGSFGNKLAITISEFDKQDKRVDNHRYSFDPVAIEAKYPNIFSEESELNCSLDTLDSDAMGVLLKRISDLDTHVMRPELEGFRKCYPEAFQPEDPQLDTEFALANPMPASVPPHVVQQLEGLQQQMAAMQITCRALEERVKVAETANTVVGYAMEALTNTAGALRGQRGHTTNLTKMSRFVESIPHPSDAYNTAKTVANSARSLAQTYDYLMGNSPLPTPLSRSPLPGTPSAQGTPRPLHQQETVASKASTVKPGGEPQLAQTGNVADFFRRFECYFDLAHIPDTEWIGRAYLRITSPIITQRWDAYAQREGYVATWADFKDQVAIYAQGHATSARAMADLPGCKQDNLSMDKYIIKYTTKVMESGQLTTAPHLISGFISGITDSTFRTLVSVPPPGQKQWGDLLELTAHASTLAVQQERPSAFTRPPGMRKQQGTRGRGRYNKHNSHTPRFPGNHNPRRIKTNSRHAESGGGGGGYRQGGDGGGYRGRDYKPRGGGRHGGGGNQHHANTAQSGDEHDNKRAKHFNPKSPPPPSQ